MDATNPLKQKKVARCVAHLKEASQPLISRKPSFASLTTNVVKNMRLDDYESIGTIVGPRSGQSYLRYYSNYKKSGRPN